MREIILLLGNGNYLFMQFSDETLDDSCVDYTIYSNNKILLDGGQMNSDSVYDSITDAIVNILEFIDHADIYYEVTGLTHEDGFQD